MNKFRRILKTLKMSVAKRLGLLKASTSALFLCDMQVKFAPNIAYFPQIVNNSKRVLGAAQVMELPILATEQYPKGTVIWNQNLHLEIAYIIFEKSKSPFRYLKPGDALAQVQRVTVS